MYNPICCRGVTLLEPFMSDRFDPNSVAKNLGPEHRSLTQSIGRIHPEGTCFLIAKSTRHLRIKNKKIVGLALTNYHVAYDYAVNRKDKSLVHFTIDGKDYRYTSKSLLELHSIPTDIQFSRTSGLPYCLSNDIGLILIIEKPGVEAELEEIEICSEEELIHTANPIVSGFQKWSKHEYMIPPSGILQDCKDKISMAFDSFHKQIISEGTMQISDSGLIDLKLSATCGMSGSPILMQSENSLKCIGIYCGGPPLEGQHLLMRVLDCINNKDYKEAINLFAQLPFDNKKLFSRSSMVEHLKHKFYTFMILNNTLDQERCEFEHPKEYYEIKKELERNGRDSLDILLIRLQVSIKKLLIETTELYKNKSRLSYNVGISIKTEAFKIVRRAIDVFRDLEGDFDDVCAIERTIRQFVASVV